MKKSFYQTLKEKKNITTEKIDEVELKLHGKAILEDHANIMVKDTPGLEYAGSAVIHYYYNKFEQHKLNIVLQTVTEKLGESAASVGVSMLADHLKKNYRGK